MNLLFWIKRPRLILPRIKFWFFERSNSDKPWLCAGTIDFLDRVLDDSMHGVEFGSGRSTRWLATKLESLVSVEHNDQWHAIVKDQLAQANIERVDYRLIPLDHEESAPEKESYEPLPNYVTVLDEFEDATVDFVLVDGHYRTTAIKHSLNKIRPGGFLVVDDTNMWSQADELPIPSNWTCVDTSSNGIKTAKIWQRNREY
ncbi:class I SAM-dependent methyltransferase [Novipirellula sp. SH528]|uniref:class I SAM-dependent methyltransferase n=1 Tax=Novipirellula sp. SH528 TaxID=3454466 RepID=UPI003FA023B9